MLHALATGQGLGEQKMQRIIAMLSDFGGLDTYVGVMKGVMLGIKPDLRLIDLTHHIQPQNVRQAAFALLNSYRYFPFGTVFLVVVDPGVGSDRKPIAAEVGGYFFVAPDNGVLSYVLQDAGSSQVVELDNPMFHLANVSDTFHGRDIFSPAAAHLAADVSLYDLGTQVEKPLLLPKPEVRIDRGHVTGEVVHIDHFGNVITSIGRLSWVAAERLRLSPRFGNLDDSLPIPAEHVEVNVTGESIQGIHRNYAEVSRGEVVVLVDSNGYLELAINQGNCAARYDIKIGDPVDLRVLRD